MSRGLKKFQRQAVSPGKIGRGDRGMSVETRKQQIKDAGRLGVWGIATREAMIDKPTRAATAALQVSTQPALYLIKDVIRSLSKRGVANLDSG